MKIWSAKFFLSSMAALAILPALLFGLDPKSLKPQGYVSDFAGVMDADSRAKLENYCAIVEKQTGVQMAMVTLKSLEGEPIEDFTNTLYRQWGVGQKGKDEGAMFLLAIQDHKDRIETGYGLEPILSAGFVGSVLREERPYLRQAQYGQAMLAAAQEMGSRIAQAKGVSLDVSLLPRARQMPTNEVNIPWPMIVIGIIVLLLIMRGGGGGGFLTGMILGNVLGGGRRGGYGGGWGGGGFGGYDGGGGGGGFGGFGGGDSGGGGASSDW